MPAVLGEYAVSRLDSAPFSDHETLSSVQTQGPSEASWRGRSPEDFLNRCAVPFFGRAFGSYLGVLMAGLSL